MHFIAAIALSSVCALISDSLEGLQRTELDIQE